MDRDQTLDSRPNIAEQTPAVVPIHSERALPLHRLKAGVPAKGISPATVGTKAAMPKSAI